jgi:hypothetical protein
MEREERGWQHDMWISGGERRETVRRAARFGGLQLVERIEARRRERREL